MADDDIARLYDFQPNTTAQSGQVDQEFNQIINTINGKASRSGVNTFSGNNTFSGMNIFSNANTFSGNNTLSGDNTFSGASSFSGTMSITSTATYTVIPVLPASDPTTANQAVRKAYVDSLTITFPKGYMAGPAPTYATSNTISLPVGLKVRSSDNTADIEVGTAITLTLASSGAGGLDTSTESSNTWYYPYLIKNVSSGNVSAVFSIVNESAAGSITLPSGYTVKRQLPLAIRNDNSSNIVPFRIVSGWPLGQPEIQYNTLFDDRSSTSTTQVGNGLSQTSPTAQSLANFVPPISKAAKIYIVNINNSVCSISVRATGESHNGAELQRFNYQYQTEIADVLTNSSQSIDYMLSASAVDISVYSYRVTEVY